MDVLIVCEYYPPYIGGVEVVFKNVAERLNKRGHNVHVVTSRLPEYDKYEVRNGVTVHRVPVTTRADRVSFAASAIPKTISLARESDIIHTTTWFAPIASAVARTITGTPAVMTYHESLTNAYDQSNKPLLSRIGASILENVISVLPFDSYTAVSNSTKKEIEERGLGTDVSVIYNGINEELFTSSDVNPYPRHLNGHIFLYYGRPGFSKGVDYLIKGFERMKEKGESDNAYLYMILSDEPQQRYETLLQQIKSSPVSEDIIVQDPVSRENLPQYIDYADTVVVPSLSEGFGFTAAEACSVGTPVITTNAGSLPEVVNGEHIIVEPQSATALAQALEKATQEEFVVSPNKTFSWEETIEQYLMEYQSVLNT
ncbi:glycosyltransferase family 4 protein [Halarchaeum sp. P4]|uniref:glycosyltransferase family 4 protein n=1 Tax=Halarchaeum sp. P4 TaxID=3421639 RepID=UPI003EBF783D